MQEFVRSIRVFVLALSVAAGAALAQDRPTGIVKGGGIGLIRSIGKISFGSTPAVESTTDFASGGFQATDYDKLPPFDPGQVTTIGACTVQVLTPPASTPNPGATTPLDAGPVLHLNGPNGPKQFPATKQFSWGGIAGGGIALNIPGFPPPPPLYLDPGTYTIDNGAGGADIGPFTATLTVPDPQFAWTNTDAAQLIDRSAGVDITWSGGDPAAKVSIQGVVSLTDSSFKLTGGGAFTCSVDNSEGHYFIPPEVLTILPPSPTGSGMSTLSVGSGVSTKFDAPGSDISIFSFEAGNARSVVYK
jgi:hypothetical protein